MPIKNSGSPTLTTPSADEIVITRSLAAPRELIFAAYTNPQHLSHWMAGPDGWTMPLCEIDLRPGGRHRTVWRRADGTEMEIRGVYEEIDRPARIVCTESWGGDWPETLNTLTLTEAHGQTSVTVTVRYPSQQARDAALQTGLEEGMLLGFDRLAHYLSVIERAGNTGRQARRDRTVSIDLTAL